MKNIQLLIVSATILLCNSISVNAQEVLTLEEAVLTSLENNHDIKLSRYDVEESKNNVSRAVSGQMPRLDQNIGVEFGYSDAELQTLNFGGEGTNPPLELDGTSRQISLQPQLSIPIFQGFSGKYRYKQLENANVMKNIELESVMEQVVQNTIATYLEVARLQSRLKITEQNIALSLDRYERVKQSAEFGAANSVRKLQALVDLKTDSTDYRNIILAYENAIRDLNLVMAENLDRKYSVKEEVLILKELKISELQSNMSQHNVRLRMARKGIEQADYDYKLAEAAKLPSASAYANYTFLDVEDDASFLQSNRVSGPAVGINLSWNIFSGGANKIKRENAKIKQFRQDVILEQTEYFLEKQLQNVYAGYQNNKEQLRVAQSNLITFETNFEKVEQDFQLGLMDASDLRIAQLNLSKAKNLINDLVYNIKQSETQLLQLSGKLIEQE